MWKQVVTYQTTVYKTQEDFNADTGRFTCRVPGVYYFTFNSVAKVRRRCPPAAAALLHDVVFLWGYLCVCFVLSSPVVLCVLDQHVSAYSQRSSAQQAGLLWLQRDRRSGQFQCWGSFTHKVQRNKISRINVLNFASSSDFSSFWGFHLSTRISSSWLGNFSPSITTRATWFHLHSLIYRCLFTNYDLKDV